MCKILVLGLVAIFMILLIMSVYYLSLFYTFARDSIAKQVSIAKDVRDSGNHSVILYDPAFRVDRIQFVSKYRVEVDSSGNWAILNVGARNFPPYMYYVLAFKFATVRKSGSIIYLPFDDQVAEISNEVQRS